MVHQDVYAGNHKNKDTVVEMLKKVFKNHKNYDKYQYVLPLPLSPCRLPFRRVSICRTVEWKLEFYIEPVQR